jgi:hypothetical protein
MEWFAWLVLVLCTVASVAVLVWLVTLGRKLDGYVRASGEAARALSAAADRALAEFPPEPAEGRRKAHPRMDAIEEHGGTVWLADNSDDDDPSEPPEQHIERDHSPARMRDRCAPDEVMPYPYDEPDET